MGSKLGGDDDLMADINITPLIDVLAFGTVPQKQALLTMVSSNFRPAFASVLKTALDDSNAAENADFPKLPEWFQPFS